MRVTWWGHATVAVRDADTTIITDPLLRDRVAHLRRRRGPAPRLGNPPDAAVISHLHSDHCDLASLRLLPRRTRLIAPRGSAGFLRRQLDDRDVTELAVGEETVVGGLRIRAVPARHDGRRRPVPHTRAPALGYVIAGSRTVWFAGDTGLYDAMSALGPIDLALVPVWGWSWTLGAGHLNPVDAAEAMRRIGPALAVPIHWGTLWPIGCGRIRPDRFHRPGAEFAAHTARVAPRTQVRVLAPGESFSLADPLNLADPLHRTNPA
ncbi:MAG: hypothetical protein QOI74_3590 [Micromonosporaceae bacterium]|jgi:L-ascorbate metabolism protein UlaG (beta-lactamase superfamily)|nr:hypothetical protein [Micromonosporaceae bacterium]